MQKKGSSPQAFPCPDSCTTLISVREISSLLLASVIVSDPYDRFSREEANMYIVVKLSTELMKAFILLLL